MKTACRARSPAKLILSGEHAVVHGYPALAMAVDRYAESMLVANESREGILFNLSNLSYVKRHTFNKLNLIKSQVLNNYHEFLKGQCHIRDVLKKPFELLQFTVSHLMEALNIQLPNGVELKTTSTIPIGCGMGSSAASVISTLYALTHFFGIDIEPQRYLSMGLAAENLQHGRSSGLDLNLALKGGYIRYQNGRRQASNDIPELDLYIVNTGAPSCSTGECVMQVSDQFKTGIGREFEAVTNHLDKAFCTENIDDICAGIRENHLLLQRIGVVPERVSALIESLERVGGAAKICGAGAIRGDQAGVVLVVGAEAERLAKQVEAFGYTLEKIRGDAVGTQHV